MSNDSFEIVTSSKNEFKIVALGVHGCLANKLSKGVPYKKKSLSQLP